MSGSIGQRVRDFREQRGWNQSDLARKARVSHSWVSRLESGKQDNPSMEYLRRVADAIGVKLSDIVNEPIPALSDDERLELEWLQQNPDLRVYFVQIAKNYRVSGEQAQRDLLDMMRAMARMSGIPTGE